MAARSPFAAAHGGLLSTTLPLGDQVRGNVGVSADRRCHQSHPLLQVARQIGPRLALTVADFFSSQAGYCTASAADALTREVIEHRPRRIAPNRLSRD